MKKIVTFFMSCSIMLIYAQSYPFILKGNTTDRLGITITSKSNAFLNGNVIFSGQNTSISNGMRLWKTDGTNSGTQMISNNCNTSLSIFTKLGNNVLFFAFDTANNYGYELWKTDGTSSGTSIVKDIYGGSTGSVLASSQLIEFNGFVYFTAQDWFNGYELWKSDGTEAGTTMVKNIATGSNSSGPGSFCVVNNQLFFVCNDGVNGTALWKTDGTASGTNLVKIINTSNPGNSFISNMINYNGTLLFSANDGIHYTELWRSDGTTSGTYMVKDILTGNQSSSPKALTLFNNKVVFRVYDGQGEYQIWQTDGTENGTTLFSTLNPADPSSNWTFFVFNNKLFVNHASNNDYLHYVDNLGNTYQISLNDGSYYGKYFASPFIFNNNLYLSSNTYKNDSPNPANHSNYGYELWKVDVNNAVNFIKDINNSSTLNSPNSSSSSLMNSNLTNFTTISRYRFDEFFENLVLFSFSDGDFSSTYSFNGISNSYNTILQNSKYNSYNVFNELLYSILPNGTNPVGSINGKVWIDTSNNQNYVKKHYELTPASNPSTSTGKITLYFTQNDFNDFNSITANTIKLPQSPTDNMGISNLKIEKFNGTSNTTTGLPNTYTNGSVTIDPLDSDIIWDNINNRWSVSFDVIGFSGFFVKTQSISLSTQETTKPTLKLYPNPTKSTLHFSEELTNIKIVDMSGKQVSATPSKTKTISVENLPKGNYLISAKDKNGKTVTEKFIRE